MQRLTFGNSSEEKRVADVMVSRFFALTPDSTLLDVSSHLKTTPLSVIPVIQSSSKRVDNFEVEEN